jgi:hypothetical protein
VVARKAGSFASKASALLSTDRFMNRATNLTTVDGHIEAIKRWRDVYNSVR